VAAESVLGVSEVRPPLLDHLPHTARRRRRRTGCHARPCETGSQIISAQAHMNTSPSADDEDDEVLEDEEFDEDAERDDDDEDADDDDEDDDEEEEETWQVLAS
jgi:phosphopantothenoylcysteine synthetase/decarboxylase